jgi:hypothetical protein
VVAILDQAFRDQWGRVLAALIGFLGDPLPGSPDHLLGPQRRPPRAGADDDDAERRLLGRRLTELSIPDTSEPQHHG